MTPKTRTVLLIFAFLALVFGSFIWFIASWDTAREESVVRHNAPMQDGILSLTRKGKV